MMVQFASRAVPSEVSNLTGLSAVGAVPSERLKATAPSAVRAVLWVDCTPTGQSADGARRSGESKAEGRFVVMVPRGGQHPVAVVVSAARKPSPPSSCSLQMTFSTDEKPAPCYSQGPMVLFVNCGSGSDDCARQSPRPCFPTPQDDLFSLEFVPPVCPAAAQLVPGPWRFSAQ